MKTTLRITLITAAVLALCLSYGTAQTKKAGEKTWLGVYHQTVDKNLAEAFKLPMDYGAIVNDVIDDSPADKAGLEEDDIIIAFNGRRVSDADELTDLVQKANPGDEVTLTIMRDGNRQDIKVVLASRKQRSVERKSSRAPSFYSFHFEKRGYLGVTLTDLTEQLGNYFGVLHGEGALIQSVENDSPAQDAGLRAGDVIVAIGDEDVEDASDVTKAMREYEEGDEVTVHIIRDKQKMDLLVTVDEVDDGDWPLVLSVPDMPPMHFKAPNMRGLYKGLSEMDLNEEDMEDVQAELRELREELQELKRELREELETLHESRR
jgi:C-terminal processing protease CtpA/Prc